MKRLLTAAVFAVCLLALPAAVVLAESTPPKPTIQLINKLTPPDDSGRFDLLVGGTAYATAVGDNGSTGAVQIDTVSKQQISVSEIAHAGTNASSYTSQYVCTKNGSAYKRGNGANVAVVVAGGDVVTCTFTNTRKPVPPGSLRIAKTVSNPGRAPVPAGYPVDYSCGGGVSGQVTVAPSAPVTVKDIPAGSVCTVSEQAPAPIPNYVWAAPTYTPGSVTISSGATSRISVGNSIVRNVGTIELTKTWAGGSSSTRLTIGSTAGGLDIAAKTVSGNGTTGAKQVTAGSSYYVNESQVVGYTGALACTNGAGSVSVGPDNSVPIGVGDHVVCTFTNTYQPPPGSIELKKVWVGSAANVAATTTLAIGSAAGGSDIVSKTVSASDTTGPQQVIAGTYYLSESQLADYTGALSCVKGSVPIAVGSDGGVIIGAGDQVLCTFTNTLNPVRPLNNDCSAGSIEFTFDDGPSENTAAVIQKLKDLNLTGTFFVNGQNIDSPEMTQAIKDEVAAGFTVGNHTYDHASFTGQSAGTAPLTAEQATAELESNSAAIVDAGAPRPTLYRPPYGDINGYYDLIARNLGYRVVMPYSTAADSPAGDGNIIDSDDYSGISAAQIADRVINGYTKVQNGVTYHWHGIQADTIIAMHDGSGQEALNTIDSLQPIVDAMNRSHLCSTATIRPNATGNILSPPPPPVPTSGNLLQNPGLEQLRTGGTTAGEPVCWQHAGYGVKTDSWTLTTDAHSGSVAQRVDVTSWTSGDDKVVMTERQSEASCLAAVTPGTSYSLWVWYTGDWPFMGAGATSVSIATFYRNTAGTWVYWQGSPSVPPSQVWNLAYFTTAPLPADATAISWGLAIRGVGTLTTDDYTMVAD